MSQTRIDFDDMQIACRRFGTTNIFSILSPAFFDAQFPLSISHTFKVLSQLAVIPHRPSGVNFALLTDAVCPLNILKTFPVSIFTTSVGTIQYPEVTVIASCPFGVILRYCALGELSISRKHVPVFMSHIRQPP